MKKLLTVFLGFSLLCSLNTSTAQEKKKAKFSLGETVGKFAGKLMTAKSEEFDGAVANISYICGFYPVDIETSETKFLPANVREGDYLVGVSFLKGEGIGMLNIEGEFTANGQPLEYIDLGASGVRLYPPPVNQPVTLKLKSVGGDEATFILKPVPQVELLMVNDETTLPIVDLAEDLKITFTNPPGSEGTRIRVSLLTDVSGVRALNHFADLEAGTEETRTVTIPKESFQNPEIAGQLNVGNFNKGDNYLIIEREFISDKASFSEDSDQGDFQAAQISSRSYSSMPVVVKGKQEEGVMTVLKIRGADKEKGLGFDIYKPNAQTGIPFSEASKFGLATFTMYASTYKQESETTSSSWTVGNTRYTQTTTITTTYQFPQLPDGHWETVMDRVYKEITAFFKENYNVDFVPVEDVTSTPQYAELFPADQSNTAKEVRKSYKNTQRINPSSVSEIWSSRSTNFTSDNPRVNMMKAAGDIDGVVSLDLKLYVAANSKEEVVLIPNLTMSISGRDETNNSKEGKYMDAVISRTTGEPFNESLLKSDPNELYRVLSLPQLLSTLKTGIDAMKVKEEEMGYTKIWSIGE